MIEAPQQRESRLTRLVDTWLKVDTNVTALISEEPDLLPTLEEFKRIAGKRRYHYGK